MFHCSYNILPVVVIFFTIKMWYKSPLEWKFLTLSGLFGSGKNFLKRQTTTYHYYQQLSYKLIQDSLAKFFFCTFSSMAHFLPQFGSVSSSQRTLKVNKNVSFQLSICPTNSHVIHHSDFENIVLLDRRTFFRLWQCTLKLIYFELSYTMQFLVT